MSPLFSFIYSFYSLGQFVQEDNNPSAKGFTVLVLLTVQGAVWFGIGLLAGYLLWH